MICNERFRSDNGPVNDCLGILSLCGKGVKAPGLWEVPMYNLNGPSGTLLMDPFNAPGITPEQVTDTYQKAFDNHFRGAQKYPFGVYLHPMWLGPAGNGVPEGRPKADAVNKFLDYAMNQPNVWMITPSQLIEYMKNPVSASEIGSQPYMQCPTPPPGICNGLTDDLAETCNVDGRVFKVFY